MPVSSSGVMLGETRSPKGVEMASPPAKGMPSAAAPPTAPSRPDPAVWHETQSPARARYSPRLRVSSGEAARAVARNATPSAIASAVTPATPFLRDPKRSSPPRAGLLACVATIVRLPSSMFKLKRTPINGKDAVAFHRADLLSLQPKR